LEAITMQVVVSSEKLEQFIERQVSEGRFSSAAAVVEAALGKLMESAPADELDDALYAKILQANDQIDRGEGRSLEDVSSELRSRYSRP
jgi:putative addiction module CopG family antidote